MYKAKSTRSVRSIRSGISIKTKKSINSKPKDESTQNFEQLLPMACSKFQCPYVIVVKKEIQQDDFLRALKSADGTPRSKRMSLIQPIIINSSESQTLIKVMSDSANTITINSIYDNFNSLTEILLNNIKKVPRILIKVIALLAPYYRNLTKITMKKCCLDMYIIYEISKVIQNSAITEVCLDGSPLPGADYSLLLNTTKLRYLSLARCQVDDEICKLIASKMHHKATAQNLALLNLPCNRITDEGVKYIGLALRTNRRLRYLNLSDNHITYVGAACILDVLIEFPLTYDEIMRSRQELVKYLQCKQELYLKFLAQFENSSVDEVSMVSRKSTGKRKKTSATTLKSKMSSAKKEKDKSMSTSVTDDYLKTKAEIMTMDLLGYFDDPFQKNSALVRDGRTFSLGNMVLSYLNLSYNDLSFVSINKLLSILIYQSVTKKPNQYGLVKIVIDGNNIPNTCAEMNAIIEILNKNFRRYSKRPSEVTYRKGRQMKN